MKQCNIDQSKIINYTLENNDGVQKSYEYMYNDTPISSMRTKLHEFALLKCHA